VLRLHQQLHDRLPAADRLGHVQAAADNEDPAVRVLAVTWCTELLPSADAVCQRGLAETLLRLSHDAAAEVQRPSVLALGRVVDERVFPRLLLLLRRGQPAVRAAAARALAQHVAGTTPEARARQRQAIPALQKALDDPALEVVVEVAEDLGALGVPEAGPVLAVLLHHPSEPVRLAAAQALERVADSTVLEGLLAALEDPSVTVRFSLVGALGRAAGDGRSLSDPQRTRLLERLESLLVRDADPGMRSRAATVLGECGPPSMLPVLWKRVLAAEDSRVQEKSWAAFLDLITRAASLDLLRQWEQTLAEAGQGPRRVQLVGEVCGRWAKAAETRALALTATVSLVPVLLEQGKWAVAFPLLRELLAQPGTDAEIDQRAHWLLTVGEQALKEGNALEVLRVVQEAKPILERRGDLTDAFEKLRKQARPQP
jgi:HEAT repeat protein